MQQQQHRLAVTIPCHESCSSRDLMLRVRSPRRNPSSVSLLWMRAVIPKLEMWRISTFNYTPPEPLPPLPQTFSRPTLQAFGAGSGGHVACGERSRQSRRIQLADRTGTRTYYSWFADAAATAVVLSLRRTRDGCWRKDVS
jgi:hypothetical protein